MTSLTNSLEFYNALRSFKTNNQTCIAALFHADWVEGCSQLIETANALNEEYSENLTFFTITADQHTELSTTFNIEKIPSLLIFTDKSSDNIKKGRKIQDISSEFMVETIESIVEEGALSLDNLDNGQSLPDNIEEIIQKQIEAMSARDVEPPAQSIDDRLKSLINQSKFMVFIKGTPDSAKCGFSRQLLEILKEQKIKFGSFDILSDETVRQELKRYSNWPTYPQIYFNGELLAGLDIFKEMISSGELASMTDIPRIVEEEKTDEVDDPNVVSPAMQQRLKNLINSHKIMVFMKGEQIAPKCRFSKQFKQIMEDEGFQAGTGAYGSFDILDDQEVRAKIKIYSNWPTFPQLYVNGELIGGIDIIKEMIEGGEFQECLAEAL